MSKYHMHMTFSRIIPWMDMDPFLVNRVLLFFNPDVDNAEQAADKVLWLHTHPTEAMDMRKKALHKVMMKYDINRVVNQHIDMFNKLITVRGAERNRALILTPAFLSNKERRAA